MQLVCALDQRREGKAKATVVKGGSHLLEQVTATAFGRLGRRRLGYDGKLA